MIEHDIEKDFDSCRMKGSYHFAKLSYLTVFLSARRVGCLWRGEGDAVVTPEISQRFFRVGVAKWTIGFIELMDGKELNRGDAKPFQIRDFLRKAAECARIRNARSGVAGKSPNMKFVDN